jgi:hypothetical protein
MKTVVLQSFRTRDVPAWMQRCLDSVQAWTQQSGYNFKFVDDAIFDLCGAEYLARVGDNKRSITNLARLELTRTVLREGYDRAIWFDADIFVFAPKALSIDVTTRYAFSKEAWISLDAAGDIHCTRAVNNAAFVFMKDQPDLDLLISTIRHIVATRDIATNYQVGVWLLTGLERSLDFPLLRTVGMLSPDVLRAIVDDKVAILQRQAIEFGDPIFAANLCFALSQDTPERMIADAMDKLEATRGDVINRFVPVQTATPTAEPWSRSIALSPVLSSAAAVARIERVVAENQAFRRSRLLRLANTIRRGLGFAGESGS